MKLQIFSLASTFELQKANLPMLVCHKIKGAYGNNMNCKKLPVVFQILVLSVLFK